MLLDYQSSNLPIVPKQKKPRPHQELARFIPQIETTRRGVLLFSLNEETYRKTVALAENGNKNAKRLLNANDGSADGWCLPFLYGTFFGLLTGIGAAVFVKTFTEDTQISSITDPLCIFGFSVIGTTLGFFNYLKSRSAFVRELTLLSSVLKED